MADQQVCIESLNFVPAADAIDICDMCILSQADQRADSPCPINGGICSLDKAINIEDHR